MKDIFKSYGRGDQYSNAGFDALHDYYSEWEDFKLDVVSVCCTWCEYDDMDDVRSNYDDIDAINYIETASGSVLVMG